MANEASRSMLRDPAVSAHCLNIPSHGRRWRRVARIAFAALLGLAFAGCIYDDDDRCGPGQVLSPDAICVCADGFAMTALGCVACGENEVAGPSGCVCADGFSRPTDAGPCQAGPSTLGVECDTASAPCTDASYGLCVATSGTAGYCSNECTSSEECDGGYACDTGANAGYCRRPPTGAGRACAAPADCADAEASYCEFFQLHQCVVAGCSPAADDCFPGTVCCDFTAMGAPTTFCLPEGSC